MNFSRLLAPLIINRYATLNELQSVYSLKDAYTLLELLTIDLSNQNLMYDRGVNTR